MKQRMTCGLFTVLLMGFVFTTDIMAKSSTRRSHARSVETTQSVVNINRADVSALRSLKGIGKGKAQAIIAYRDAHGRFNQLSDLSKVKGIGPAFLARLEKNNPKRIIFSKQ